MHQRRSAISLSGEPEFHDLNFDQILARCGDFGRYQLILLTLFGLVNILVSMHYFTQTMISFVPDHWCYHEKLVNKSYAEIEEIYSHLPNPACTELLDIDGVNVTLSGKECTRWIYEYDFGYKSMNMELNWVCDAAYKSTVGQSLFFIGSMVGTLFFGLLSDKIGRLPALIFSNLSGFAGDFLTIFTREEVTFSVCRFISGWAADTNSYLMYIIVLEYIRPNMRTLGINLMVGIFYCLGLVFSPWLAVLTGDWKYYLCCTSIPLLSIIAYYFIIQESAQWLVTRQDFNGAINRLQKVAKINGRYVSPEEFEDFHQNCVEKQLKAKKVQIRRANVFDLFRTPRLRRNTIILLFKSMVITLCYDTVSRNVEGLGYSPFIVFSISSLAVLPASLVIIFLQENVGRKAMAAGSLFFAAIIATTTGIVLAFQQKGDVNAIILIVLTFAARFGVAMSFEAGSQYATELMPTCVRGQGVATVHVAGSAVSFLAPYILFLGRFFKAAPSFILSVLLFAGAFVCLLLPETLNRSLPTTIEDGEEFGKGERICDFPCIKKRDSK